MIYHIAFHMSAADGNNLQIVDMKHPHELCSFELQRDEKSYYQTGYRNELVSQLFSILKIIDFLKKITSCTKEMRYRN